MAQAVDSSTAWSSIGICSAGECKEDRSGRIIVCVYRLLRSSHQVGEDKREKIHRQQDGRNSYLRVSELGDRHEYQERKT